LALIICGGLRRPQYAADLPIYVPLATSSRPLGGHLSTYWSLGA